MPANSGPVVQVPDILGGVAVAYNLPGVSTRIKLDGPTLAGIFDGTITTWNASQITALNPGVTLPSHAIVPEVRADSSGTTYIFTDYLTSANPTAWTLGASKTIAWPSAAVQTPKNSGVAVVDPVHPVLDRLRRAVLRHPEQVQPTPPSRTPPAPTWCPSLTTVAADADQKTGVSRDRLLDRQPGRCHQLPDRRLQLGHPAAEADQRHHRRPGGEGPRLDDPHRWWPGPGAGPRLRGRCRRPCRTRTGRSCSP